MNYTVEQKLEIFRDEYLEVMIDNIADRIVNGTQAEQQIKHFEETGMFFYTNLPRHIESFDQFLAKYPVRGSFKYDENMKPVFIVNPKGSFVIAQSDGCTFYNRIFEWD